MGLPTIIIIIPTHIIGMITESDVSIQNSAKTSSDTLTVLASTFGTIVFIVLIIVATLVLFVAYSAKRTREIILQSLCFDHCMHACIHTCRL